MFHLFNKVYLGFDFDLEMPNKIVVSKEFGELLFEVNGAQQFIATSYDGLVDEYFDGDEENLWAFLTNIPYDNSFGIYVEEDLFLTFMIKYFRAIFTNTSDSDLYVLYRLTMLKFKLIHGQIVHTGRVMSNMYHFLNIMSKPEFMSAVKKISKIKPFSNKVKENVGIEMMMPSYLLDTDTIFDTIFENTAHKIVWKSIAWEINEFKRNGLNGFFNLDELFDEIPTLDFETATFDDVVKHKPELKFMQDADVNPNNLDYIRDNYSVSEIFQFYEKYQKQISGGTETMDAFLKAHMEYDGTNSSVLSDNSLVPAEDLRGIIQMDIDTNFGTQLFARAEYRKKMNPFIISFFYDMVRTGNNDKLKKYLL